MFILNIAIQELFRGKYWLDAISGYLESIPIIKNTGEKTGQFILYNSSKVLNISWNMTNKPWSRIHIDFIDKYIEFSKDFFRKDPNSNSNLCCKSSSNGLLICNVQIIFDKCVYLGLQHLWTVTLPL